MTYYFHSQHDVFEPKDPAYLRFLDSSLEYGHWICSPSVTLHYCIALHEAPKGCIVIFPGRAEAIVKYEELLFELFQNGYSVFALDHRGQGGSSRALANPHMGYIESFDDYITDATACIENVLIPQLHKQALDSDLYLLCHSMGSAIGVHFLQANATLFKKVCFSAPMLGINLPLPEVLVKAIAKSAGTVYRLLGKTPRYFWGQGDYKPYPFITNQLTNSEIRYASFRKTMAQSPEAQLGGITFTWLTAAINAMQSARIIAKHLMMPVLVLQAEEEQIVDNKKMSKTVESMPQARCVVIPKAKHEILFEKDPAKHQALSTILDFFAKP